MHTHGTSVSQRSEVAESEVAESNRAFIACWKKIYPKLPRGEYRELPGLAVVWGDAALPFCNAVLLSHPVQDLEDLEARVETLQIFLAGKNKPPMFLLCRDWPERVRPFANAVIGRAGLRPAIPLRGMVANRIVPPVRPLPELEYRRVCDEETRNLISDINSMAYGFGVEYGREVFTLPEAWLGDCYGYVGFRKGLAVAASATSVLGRYLYVGFVATLPGEQRRGYAEAVLRYSLARATEETGLRRFLLHATDDGYPLYLRMGYRDTARFMGYVRI